MTRDDLTPAEREEIQGWYLRSWWSRRRRAALAATKDVPARVRYDMGGRIVALAGRAVTPRVSRWDEDRAPAS